VSQTLFNSVSGRGEVSAGLLLAAMLVPVLAVAALIVGCVPFFDQRVQRIGNCSAKASYHLLTRQYLC
jgi:hypothetical protein